MTLPEKFRHALRHSIPKDTSDAVGVVTQTLTTTLALVFTGHNSIESALVGQTLGALSKNFTAALWHTPPPPGMAAADPHAFFGIAPIPLPDTAPGFCCFILDTSPRAQAGAIAHVFPAYFPSEPIARAFAQIHHPLWIEPFADPDNPHPAVYLWAKQPRSAQPFALPQGPWILAQMLADPKLYGAWRPVLTPHGTVFEVLATDPQNPTAWIADRALPPWVAPDPAAVRRAIRTLGPPGQAIPHAQYLPQSLRAQLTWRVDPTHPQHLYVDRRVERPDPLVASPPVTRGTLIPRSNPAPTPVWEPHWYVSPTPQHGVVLWRPLDDAGTFVLGGSTDADHQWRPHRFAQVQQGLDFLCAHGLWGQVHPTLQVALSPVQRPAIPAPRSRARGPQF